MEALSNINFQFYLAAFLIGGIPFGVLLAYLFAGIDIRKKGSGSIGATNVLRVVKEKDPILAKKLAIATIILDSFKGIAILLVAIYAKVPEETLWAIAVLAVIGHCFSPYLMFEGGKGVATSFGVMLIMMPLPAILGILTWFFVGRFSKISSLSSLVGISVLLGSSYIFYPEVPHINSRVPLFLIIFFVVYKHIPNIIRLITGQEKAVV